MGNGLSIVSSPIKNGKKKIGYDKKLELDLEF